MGGRPFYQRPWFLATAAVVALAGGIWSGVGAPTPWKLVSDLVTDDVAAYNTMIVLDASGGMRDRFGRDGTKFDAAAEAVEEFVSPFENQGFGLRTFGGSCERPGTRHVDLGAKHNDDVSDAVKEIEPRGNANLSTTLTAAIDDLSREDRVPAGSPKQIVVFTGSGDACGRDTADDLRSQMKLIGVTTVFKIVAVKPSARATRTLRRLKRRLGDAAELQIATTESDLTEAIETTQDQTQTLETQTTTTETQTTTTETQTTTTDTPPPPPPTTDTTPQPEPEPDPDPGPEPDPGG
jgi:von Willebrand factor type A domain